MNNQEIIIKLINEIDKIVKDEYFEDDLIYEDDLLNNFSDEIDNILKDNLNDEILCMINKLEYKNIFRLPVGNKYINNPIRIKIEEYINKNDKLLLNFEMLKNYIQDNYKLARYVKDRNKIIELLELNDMVVLYLNNPSQNLIEKMLNKSDFISKIFLGIYGQENDIFKYSNYYKNIKNIDQINYNNLKDILLNNPYLYINSSDIIKNNNLIKNLMISIDGRYEVYFSE